MRFISQTGMFYPRLNNHLNINIHRSKLNGITETKLPQQQGRFIPLIYLS